MRAFRRGGRARMACSSMRHTVVISDVHLSEVERGSGLWMRYRQRPYLPDGEIAAMLGAVRRELRDGDELTVALNGDIFDFDAPRVIAGESVFHDLPRTAEHPVRPSARISGFAGRASTARR